MEMIHVGLAIRFHAPKWASAPGSSGSNAAARCARDYCPNYPPVADAVLC